jgi:predicted DNA-binding mobile mystery protein A
MGNSLLALKQLDQRFFSLKEKELELLAPRQGWVRTLRKSLGMTIKQLAQRLAVDPSRVIKIETSEIEGAITIKTLKNVAEVLDCHLVYSFVPKESLEKTIRNRAHACAVKQLARTSHTMDLEKQSVDKNWLEGQLSDLTEALLRQSWRHLWKNDEN